MYQYEPLWPPAPDVLVLPGYPGAKLTLKRVANCYRNRGTGTSAPSYGAIPSS